MFAAPIPALYHEPLNWAKITRCTQAQDDAALLDDCLLHIDLDENEYTEVKAEADVAHATAARLSAQLTARERTYLPGRG